MGSSSSRLGIPQGKGPEAVGCTDLMVDHGAQGSFFRLYYPCRETGGGEKPDWIPSREYFTGLADFMKINRALSEGVFNRLYGSCKIPACLDAPFKTNAKCPVIVFSHGLGAFRTLYSAICVEMASRGFIVASVEHRDESASATFYLRQKSESERAEGTASGRCGAGPEGPVKEWMFYRPLQQGESEFTLRNAQVNRRADECILALEKLAQLNAGVPLHNLLQTPFDSAALENGMDLCRTAIMGHSFGGATVVKALSKEQKFRCGVALDAWMFPLEDQTFPQVKQPLFFINSEKFQWAGNISRMRKLDSSVAQRKMITIRGTVHQSFPDFTFLTGNWIGRLMKLKGELDPELAINLCNKATLAFLQRHLGLDRSFDQWDPLIDGRDENLVEGTNIGLLQSAI